MTNEFTNTELSALVSEQWGPRYIAALYEPATCLPYALNVTQDFHGTGDIAHIAYSAAMTVNDTGSDGGLTVQKQTLTDVSVTINKDKEVTSEIIAKSRDQAYNLFEKSFPTEAGQAVREQMEADFLALVRADITNAAGDGLGNLGEDEYLAAIQTLANNKLPILAKPDEHYFAIHTSQFGPAKKQNFLDYDRTGEAGAGGAAGMRIPKLWSIPVVFTTQVEASSSIRYSVLAHRSALCWAAQRNVTPRFADRLAAAKLSYLMNVSALYGVKTVIAARAVQLKSKQ